MPTVKINNGKSNFSTENESKFIRFSKYIKTIMKAYEWELKNLNQKQKQFFCDAGEPCYIELYFDELSSGNHLNVFPIKNESRFMKFSNQAGIEKFMKAI